MELNAIDWWITISILGPPGLTEWFTFLFTVRLQVVPIRDVMNLNGCRFSIIAAKDIKRAEMQFKETHGF